jgi:LacI family transcriptional regulator
MQYLHCIVDGRMDGLSARILLWDRDCNAVSLIPATIIPSEIAQKKRAYPPNWFAPGGISGGDAGRLCASRPRTMKNDRNGKGRRVAISLELEWAYKRHLQLYAGCQQYADEVGWLSSVNPAIERMLGDGKGERPYDGVLARANSALAAAAKQAGVPLVNVWLNTPVQDLPSVYPDYEASGVLAAEHLLGRGFRQFGYLGFLRDIDSEQQLAGFRKTTRNAGFPCTAQRFVADRLDGLALGWEQFIADLGAWIDRWETPIGIFVSSDLYCRYLIDVCRAKGLHVSQDVAIIGTSNEPEICNSPEPSLTSIDMGYGQVGYRAAAMLDRLMSGGEPPSSPELVAPAELVPRRSTDVYASDDLLVARALRYISENSHLRIQVKDVASAVATTRRTLERRFSASAGRTIADEITRLRLERAKRRMVETDAPMKDVAVDAGFRNSDHFYKVFARIEGIPPTQYREERQQAFPEKV